MYFDENQHKPKTDEDFYGQYRFYFGYCEKEREHSQS